MTAQRWELRAALALAARPWLWATAVTQLVRLAPSGWWRRWPPLPVPDASYLRFRLQTAYGDPERDPDPGDVLAYLTWCRRARR
ncbi:MAG: hypothetical protein KY450_02940 [Actinobacteria bacterium]|nr:hypothetical protein [Actinomycetota bacterium]